MNTITNPLYDVSYEIYLIKQKLDILDKEIWKCIKYGEGLK